VKYCKKSIKQRKTILREIGFRPGFRRGMRMYIPTTTARYFNNTRDIVYYNSVVRSLPWVGENGLGLGVEVQDKGVCALCCMYSFGQNSARGLHRSVHGDRVGLRRRAHTWVPRRRLRRPPPRTLLA